jgi:hypothetical protein
MTTQHIIYPTRYAGTTLVSFADNLERAHEIFMNVMDVAVVCVDIPRSELCVNCAQAHAFFERGADFIDAADLIESQAAEIASLRGALTPFAAEIENWRCDHTKEEFDAMQDGQSLNGCGDTDLVLGDLRRADKILKEGGR